MIIVLSKWRVFQVSHDSNKTSYSDALPVRRWCASVARRTRSWYAINISLVNQSSFGSTSASRLGSREGKQKTGRRDRRRRRRSSKTNSGFARTLWRRINCVAHRDLGISDGRRWDRNLPNKLITLGKVE